MDKIQRFSLNQAYSLTSELIRLRRVFHQYPELGYQEIRTARTIARLLNECKLEVHTGIAKTGVVGILRGKKKGKTVAIRSDMDALPIQERTGKRYASKRKGIMHACGHDGKMAVVLGLARILSQIKAELKGQIKFIFQPNEEGGGGAEAMIKEGVLSKPKVHGMFGLDINPYINTGMIGFLEGVVTAKTQDFEIKITSERGHVSRPHEAKDPIFAACEIIQKLQYIQQTKINPVFPSVVSVGVVKTEGVKVNVIAQNIILQGTVRSLNNNAHDKVVTSIGNMVKDICKVYALKYSLKWFSFYPMLVNDTRMNHIVINEVKDMLGEKALYFWPHPFLGGEDLSFFFQKVQGVIFSIGVRNERKGIVHTEHTPFFDIDEAALPLGTSILTASVLRYLQEDKAK